MIRLARPGDAGWMRECARAAFGPYSARIGRDPAPMHADPDPAIAQAEAYLALAPDAGPVGYVICRPVAGSMLLETLAVWPGRSGQGVGTRLVSHVEHLARAANLAAVELYTNAAMFENLPFYARLGYRQTGRGRQDGFERIFFRKDVAPRRA